MPTQAPAYLSRHVQPSISRSALTVLSLVLTGCGGAMPLGHPAHALPAGKVSVGAGVAATMIARSSAASTSDPASRLQSLAVAPDISPWVSARAGLGSGFEAGLAASARSLRIDGRRAFTNGRVALSVGLGASAVLAAHASGTGDASDVHGGGFDVPVLVGWRSTADLYAVWIGPRVGADFLTGQADAGASGPTPASVHHMHFGGVAGLRAGLRRIYGLLEVEAAYHLADGTLGARPLTLDGWTIAPVGALVFSF